MEQIEIDVEELMKRHLDKDNLSLSFTRIGFLLALPSNVRKVIYLRGMSALTHVQLQMQPTPCCSPTKLQLQCKWEQ